MGRPTLGPALRLAIGLALMSVCLFVTLDLATGLIPDPGVGAGRLRTVIAESLAERVGGRLQRADHEGLQRELREARERHPDIEAIVVRTLEGEIKAGAGDLRRLAPGSGVSSKIDRIEVPLLRNGIDWGRVQLAFSPVYPRTLSDWLHLPIILTIGGLLALGIPLYGLYLRRALQLLDPSSAVPGRVRAAFDTLAEGVVVLDKDGRVVLANQIFRELVPAGNPDLLGQPLDAVSWLMAGLRGTEGQVPWKEATMRDQVIENVSVELADVHRDGGMRRFLLRANPISDAGGSRRGCILTLDDVSDLHESNRRLSEALHTLEQSQTHVQKQNESLKRLADRDPMTDCLNRRAFFAAAAALWTGEATARPLVMAMCDIDFFKNVNDRHGHLVGDQVIRATAGWLSSVSREEDLICRMGGEEFCVLWLRLPPEKALARAEDLRRKVELAPPLITEDGQQVKVTISVGLLVDEPRNQSFEGMLARADQALYEAKRQGRNRVVRWPFETAGEQGPVGAPAFGQARLSDASVTA